MLTDKEVLEILNSMWDLLLLQRNCLDLKQGKTELERDAVRKMSKEIFALDKAIAALKQQDKRCKICKYFHDINIRLFKYYCPNCGAKMEVSNYGT